MRGPRYPVDYPDRHIDAQADMVEEFVEFVEKAEEAGWPTEWVLAAIADLVENHTILLRVQQQDEDRIRDAARRKAH